MGRNPDNIPDVAMEKFDVQMQIYGIVSFARCQFFQIYTTAIYSLKPSDRGYDEGMVIADGDGWWRWRYIWDILLTWINLTPNMDKKLVIHSQTSTVQSLKFGNGLVISSHIL